jgi:putative endonuclease
VGTDTRQDPRRRLGALGERLAREHLERAGYTVVERNYRSRRGEIDAIAVGHGALVFCEIKTRVAGSRAGPASPLEGIGPGKRRRLRLLAREWLSTHSGARPGADTLRFDAIGVTLDQTGALVALEHLEGAF